MSKFKVLLIGGIAAGVLAGGTIALFTSGKKPATSGTAPAPAAKAEPPAAAPAPSAPAGTPADRAAALNEKGKNLMFAGKFAEATPVFRDAVILVPEPKYFFNLGTSLFQEGKFDEALAALNAIRSNSPTPEQLTRTRKLRAKVLDECKLQKMECNDPWPADKAGSGESEPAAPQTAAEQADRLKDRAKDELSAGRMDTATRYLEQSLALNPTSAVRYYLAFTYFQQDMFDMTIPLCNAVLASEAAGSPLRARATKLLAQAREQCASRRIACPR